MLRYVIPLLAVCLPTPLLAAEATSQQRRPFVVLAHDDTGDFGPGTPETKTAGWQEALGHCVANHMDLYVKGGWGGRKAIYHVEETIRIPASQDFRIDGGVYVINWTGPKDKDLLVVDSGMDCHYKFGILVYGGHRAALRVKPENPVPIDKVAVFTDSDISASSIADPHPFQRGRRAGGAGVVFDTSKASISHADFTFTAILNFATCVVMPDDGQGFVYNEFACGHLHTNADDSTLLRLGRQATHNTLRLRIGVDQGAKGVRGVDLSGGHNSIDLTTRGGFSPGDTLILGESAKANQVNLICGGSSLSALIDDKAQVPTNQVSWTEAPPAIQNVRPSNGNFIYVQRLFPATVRLTGGDVSKVALMRGTDSVDYSGSKNVLMSVGDRLQVEGNKPPTLTVVPVKVR